MAKLQYRSISKRTVEGLKVEKDTVFWDRELTGFGVRAYPSGSRYYVAQTRGPEGQKRVTVGRHGIISADQARRRAALIIARIKAGEEPVPALLEARTATGPTVAGLAERYLREHAAVRCKPRTAERYRSMVSKHILPGLGKLPAAALGREHVIELHYRLRRTPVMANMVIALLSQMIKQAGAWGLIPEGGNPCRFVVKYRERKRERFLTEEEFHRLGRVLDELEAGGRMPLHAAAAKVLVDLPRVPGNPWVIAGRKPGVRLSNFHIYWYRARAGAGLEDVRLHDLRHSFASRALALGESLPMIGKLLGHSQIQTTARYAHLARGDVKVSAAKVAASIGEDILSEDSLAPPAPGVTLPAASWPPGGTRLRKAARHEHPAPEALKASAARIAACIGADILPGDPGPDGA